MGTALTVSVADNAVFQRAMAALQAANFKDAERLFKDVLRGQPKHVAALNLLGVTLTQLGKFAEAETYLRGALQEYPKSDATLYNYGIVLKALNRPAEAADRFSRALALNPRAPETWNNRGTTFNDLKRYQEAIGDFDKAIALQPRYAEAFCNKGKSLAALGRPKEALASYEQATALRADLAEAWLGRAFGYTELKRTPEALAAFERALAIGPDLVEGWLGAGSLSSEIGRHREALAAYDKALALRPGLAEAKLGRCNALAQIDRQDEALKAYDELLAEKPDLAEVWVGRGNIFTARECYDDAFVCYDKALALKPNLAYAWVGRGNVFLRRKSYDDAAAAYDKSLELNSDSAVSWVGRGNVYSELKRYAEALAAYEQALAIQPGLAEAWHGRGNVLIELGRYADALDAYNEALSLRSDFAQTWYGAATALSQLRRYGEALTAYDKSLALNPKSTLALCGRLSSKLRACDWSDLQADTTQLLAAVREGKTAGPPFALLGTPAAPSDQLQCARRFVEDRIVAPAPSSGGCFSHDRIRLAYLSPDLHEHAVAYLMAGVFEVHDRSAFEITALSWTPQQDTDFCRRLRSSFDRFEDVSANSDQQIADLIRLREIDIVVDLNGFAGIGRIGLLASRPAPIQVNYLGYAGTMGAPYYDYILADSTIIPREHFDFYSEKVVWLPDTFMASDSTRRIADHTPSRRELGLPETGFVFCCFNQSLKINPEIFDIWMRLLHAVSGSVLWLKDNDPTSTQNLRRAAELRGIAAERLVFAASVPNVADHLARHRQADLFLDTLHYNAHTTANDSLWAGTPILTCIGTTYASRVAASLLRAVGLPELVTESLDEYEKLALKIAHEPESLASLKSRLARNRNACPLFDTTRFTRGMEAAYKAMWQRARQSEPPTHIAVPRAVHARPDDVRAASPLDTAASPSVL
jgi:protein O-GlcNAc transferase